MTSYCVGTCRSENSSQISDYIRRGHAGTRMQILPVTSLLWVMAVTSGMVLPDPGISSPASVSGDSVAMETTAASSHTSPATVTLPASSESTPSRDEPLTNDRTSSIPVMPSEWEGMCHVTELTARSRVIHCDVTTSSDWEIDTFSDWAEKLDTDHSVDLEVICFPGASIGLHWPYRIPRLRSLTVKNCTMRGWLDAIYRMDKVVKIEDRLEHLRMENNAAAIPLNDLRSVLRNTTAEFECGPQNLRTYVQSGNTYDFDPLEIASDNMTEDELLMLFNIYLRRTSVSEYECKYTNLESYEQTHRRSTNVFFTHLLKINTKLPRLRHINLSYNGYDRVPETVSVWQGEFPALETLNMSHNAISRFSMKVFGYQARGDIDFTHNNISTLGKEEVQSFKVLSPVHIDVRNNPYHCACPTAEFSDFLYEHGGPEKADLNPYYAYLWDMTCQSPPELKGRRISEFTREELCQENRKIFGLFIILPVVIALIVLYFVFRLEVDVFVFAHMGWLWRIGRRKGDEDNKDYDVYVSHSPSQHDTAFVYRELRPRLETSTSDTDRKYKLCLEGRDFQVGAHIAENILTKMADSRAVVMVLSRDMPVDGWAEFEFQEALFRAVSERRRLLVFLQRGPLDIRRLSSALRRALNLFPLIKVGERQFWRKLDYFLKRHASFPVKTSRSGCPCRSTKFDPEKELKEVSRMARADLEKSRRSMRSSSPSSPIPALSTSAPPAHSTGGATPINAVDTDASTPNLCPGNAPDVDVTSASTMPAISNDHCSSIPEEIDAELPSYSECVDAPSLPSSTADPCDSMSEQEDTKNEEKSPQRRDCSEDGGDHKVMLVFANKAYEANECMV